jgi:hypothetical protein
MKPRPGRFLEYVAAMIALDATKFHALRLVQQRKALARRRLGRDEAAEQRWYGEGGNPHSRGARP